MAIHNQIDEFFHEEELIGILKGLVQINSENPGKGEVDVAEYIQSVCAENGIQVTYSWAAPNRPNLYIVLEGTEPGPTLLYNGHLDVVPPGEGWSYDPFTAVIEDGKLYGRGASDMKSGVAAMLYAAVILKRMGLTIAGKLILFFNVDEEVSNLGMKQFLKDGISADYAVIGEPTELDVCIGHKGVANYRIHTYGTASHVGFEQNPDNAIYKMMRLVSALEKAGNEIRTRQHKLIGNASLNVTKIHGGTATNTVPSHTVIELDRRLLPGEEVKESIFNELESIVKEVAEIEKIDYKLESGPLFLPASIIEEDHPLVTNALAVSREITNIERTVQTFRASCEAPFFSVDKGIPTLLLGPGSLKQAHCIDEFVEIKEVMDSAKIYILLAYAILKG